jgi:predicted nucleotidyltransferase
MPMISHQTIEKAVNIMVETATPVSIILFGSYARGEATDYSDLDFLVIEKKFRSRFHEMVRIRKSLRSMDIPADVLVHDEQTWSEWRDVPGTILNTIAREGKVVYERYH